MTRVASGDTARAPTSRFTGDVRVDWITDRAQADSARLAAVRFSPGAREAPGTPGIGIRANTHFPFSDLNNEEIAELMARFLAEKGLD